MESEMKKGVCILSMILVLLGTALILWEVSNLAVFGRFVLSRWVAFPSLRIRQTLEGTS